MKIIVAPDSYKGNLTAKEVADAVEKGIKNANQNIDVEKVPMADGGEGTTEALVSATNGTLRKVIVQGPLGEAVEAFYGILGDGETAVIEMAAASGIMLVPSDKLNPLYTSTFGTGQLIKEAVKSGCKKIIMGIGGSATNDGGMGMAQALGIEFFDKDNNELGQGGIQLEKVYSIKSKGLILDNNISIEVACDVQNKLYGKDGAAYVYAAQKGADEEMIERLDKGLQNYAKAIKKSLSVEIDNIYGGGAAGGLGAGLVAFLNAKLSPGIDIVVDASKLEDKVRNADLVITGEGKTDYQTAFGKVPSGVAKIAKKHNIPVVCLSGALGENVESLYEIGINALFSTANKDMTLEYAIKNSKSLIQKASENIVRLFLCK